jgi:hypothetical protein
MSVADKLRALAVRGLHKMKDLASISRRNRVAHDSTSTTSSTAEPEDGVRELLDVEAFREAVTLDLPVVNVDIPTKRTILHSHPGDCSGVKVGWFIQKVIEHDRATGGYFVVRDERAAKTKWPEMTRCKRCS